MPITMYEDSLDLVFPYRTDVDVGEPIEGATSERPFDAFAGETGQQDRQPTGRQDGGLGGRHDAMGQADNSEVAPLAAALKAIARAEKCCARIPERDVDEKTAKGYMKTFLRMYKGGSLDPLVPGIAFDTYYYRRAALHFGGVTVIRKLTEWVRASVVRQDKAEAAKMSGALRKLVDKIEIAFERDPPGKPNVLPWEGPTSRFHQMAIASVTTLPRGANSKKHVLGKLDRAWDQQLWLKAVEVKFLYLLPLAVHLTVPVRPEEMVPGERPKGWSPGIVLDLPDPRRLEIRFMPVKSHHGCYGTELTTVTLDPTIADEPAKYLAACCREAGCHMVVSVKSKNAVRKAIKVLGETAFPECEVTITPTVMRHQLIADLKKTFGAGQEVATASGHGTDRTQARYGYLQHGRKRRGYIEFLSARTPRAGNIERTKLFEKRPHPKK
ncbi:hypothetical protein EAS56_28015 [Bradyrhizobium guangzhouense]|uniref:Tyr recombinase domain-containing protein n=1 Tax=Bradyrhizobium guangzhouense TaxID=1325095 RepID=A0ABY0DZA3_9BRAD|nr:hypothetical protein [Bradyrhizobium guangzhouense]RXH08760.1 hypothetical protein EAS56_28015 [Bradyrhizobium guangzhouense]